MSKTLIDSTKSHRETQASRFEIPLLGSEPPRLQIAKVPRDRAIGQDRYYLEICQPSDRMAWHFPIQLQREEGYRILRLLDAAIEHGMLQLSYSDGFPVRSDELYALLECLVDAEVAA